MDYYKNVFQIYRKKIAFLLSVAFISPVLALPVNIEKNSEFLRKIFKEKQSINVEIKEPVVNIYPIIEKKQPKTVKQVHLTAYSSTIDQCDNDPFTTASGSRVHEGTIAANCLPFGTMVKIPELFGDKIFIVEDRLAPRMGCNTIDIWFSERQQAINFGKAYAEIQIL